MSFLLDLGVEKTDGALRFRVEELSEPPRLKRITAEFLFSRERNLQLESEQFAFQPDDSIRLFFSYRHTPTLIRTLLGGYGLDVIDQWITASGEEGVFLVQTMRP
jgi:hypothetical protein